MRNTIITTTNLDVTTDRPNRAGVNGMVELRIHGSHYAHIYTRGASSATRCLGGSKQTSFTPSATTPLATAPPAAASRALRDDTMRERLPLLRVVERESQRMWRLQPSLTFAGQIGF